MSARCYLSPVIANVTKSDELPKIEDGNAIALFADVRLELDAL
jgi:hypothetical protein